MLLTILKDEIEFIIKSSESLAKTNQPHECILNLSQRFYLKISNKKVALENLSIYYTWKNIRKQYKKTV